MTAVKRPRLQAELAQQAGKVQPGAEKVKRVQQPSRDGTVLLGVHVRQAVRNQVKSMAGEMGVPAAQLVAEGLNMMFAKYGRQQIA